MDITYELCRFDVPSAAGLYIDKESMIRVLNSDRFKTKMANHDTIGSVSHAPREIHVKDPQLRHLPVSDMLLKDGEAVNYTKELYIDGEALIAKLHILSTEKGKQLKELVREDNFVPNVSMSVQADIVGNRYIINGYNGTDFTFDPALKTKLVNIDFSVGSELNLASGDDQNPNLDNYKKFLGGNSSKDGTLTISSSKALDIEDDEADNELNQSLSTEIYAEPGAIQPEIENTPSQTGEDFSFDPHDDLLNQENFSEINSVYNQCEQVNFSLQEYVRLRKRKPILVMQMLVQNVLRYINSKTVAQLEEDKYWVLEYIEGYIRKFITDKINDPTVHQLNLPITLGLNRYCDRKAIYDFQIIANQVSRELATQKNISKMRQRKMAVAMGNLMRSFRETLMKKVNDPAKVELFLGTKKKEPISDKKKAKLAENKSGKNATELAQATVTETVAKQK